MHLQVFKLTIKKILDENNRESIKIKHLMAVNEMLKKYGITKLNVDIMYGLPNQTIEICDSTMDVIECLAPEQVTLYETRYNLNAVKNEDISREVLFNQYCRLFQRLKCMGYSARFGQNTFTRGDDDGVSSYLKYRMNKGIAYKGFGISAQSMSKSGISYNSLKLSQERYMPNISEIKEEYNYTLPPEEIAAKYVCIALYSAKFSLNVLSDIIGCSALDYYADAFDILQENKYISITNNKCYLTPDGFMYYGAVAAMFWSENHQIQYLSLKSK